MLGHFITILWSLIYVTGLRSVQIVVPRAVVQGEEVLLRCLYDLEGDPLYSVKWYHGTTEFFRFTPKETPRKKQFHNRHSGIIVDESESNGNDIKLMKIPQSANGQYSCEVTTDQPSFFTDIQTDYMHIVLLPHQDPQILGLRARYYLGDSIRANCTVQNSRPVANLTWFRNGNALETDPVQITKDHQGRFTVVSSLNLIVSTKDLHQNRMKIRCSARIFDIYHRSHEKSVEIAKERKKNRHKWRIQQKPTPTAIQNEIVQRTKLIFYTKNGTGWSCLHFPTTIIILTIIIFWYY